MMSFAIGGLLILVGYLLGSIPTGYLIGRFVAGIDIRQEGSGSTGATNVLRTVGKTAGISVLIIDCLKGAFSVALVKGFFSVAPTELMDISWMPWLVTLAALAAVLGHSRSIWINFTGGKSVATGLGVLLVMSPVVALSTLGVFGVSLAISRIVSLSSIAAAIAMNGFMFFFYQPLPYLLFAALAGGYVILRHQTNIQRLWAGTEPKIGQKLQEDQA